MSVNGIGPTGLPGWLRAPGEGAARPSEESQKVGRSQTARPQTAPVPQQAAPTGADGVPEGVDAELWSLLTTEERAHFAKFAAMGGVTYGPGANRSARPPVRGHRLDMKV